MSKRRSEIQKRRAKKRASKEAAMKVPQAERQTSKCAKRAAARHNGAPMSSRAHEFPPWWDRGVRGSFGALIERTAVSLGSRMM